SPWQPRASSPRAVADSGRRQVAMTDQPRPAYWRTNSSPMPRLVPVTRTVGMPASCHTGADPVREPHCPPPGRRAVVPGAPLALVPGPRHNCAGTTVGGAAMPVSDSAARIAAWLTLATGDFPRWFGWYGWLPVLPALLSFPFPPAGFLYIQLTVVWA